MTTHPTTAAVIFGVGAPEGIGAAVARKLSAEGMHAYVVGCHADKLQAVTDQIQADGGQATAVAADCTQQQEVAAVFAKVSSDGRTARFVLHNVGTNVRAGFMDLTPDLMEAAWRTNCLSGFHVAKQAIPHMLPQGGSLFFTGATASMRGGNGFAAFAAGKAGLRIYAQALAREFGPKGIHVAHVIVDGVVNGDRIRRFIPGLLDQLGEDGSLSPEAIADNYWQLHQQHRTTWTHEMDLRPCKENW